MQSRYRPGVISTTLDWLAPIGQLAASIGLQSGINRIADWTIGQYQRHLSPRKGFSCAHRKLHGGASCSGYFRELVTTEGFSQAIQPFQQRLIECGQAYAQLRMLAAAAEGIPLDDPAEPPTAPKPATSSRTPSGRTPSSGDNANFSRACDGGHCALEGCNAIDFAACELPHFSACDAGACDFGAVDPGACVGACDCNF